MRKIQTFKAHPTVKGAVISKNNIKVGDTVVLYGRGSPKYGAEGVLKVYFMDGAHSITKFASEDMKYKHPSRRYRTFGGRDYKLYAYHDSKDYLKRLQKKFGYGRIVALAKSNPFGEGKKWGMYVPI